MAAFTIDGIEYRSGMMDGEKQMLVMRRLAPTFTALIGAAPKLAELMADKGVGLGASGDGSKVDAAALEDLAAIMAPVSIQLAAISDADVLFVVNACLDVTEMQNQVGVGWSKVRAPNGIIMDRRNNTFGVRLKIAWAVLSENFAEMFASFGLDVKDLTKRIGG